MQFNSIEFIFSFLPISLLLYYLLPGKLQPFVLSLLSLVFYGLSSNGNYWWVALLLFLCAVAFIFQRFWLRKGRAYLLAVCVILFAAVLCFLKIHKGGILLPAGISFYLFQLTATMVDVYRGKISPYTNVVIFFRDIAMFPKLLSGPLLQPERLAQQPGTVKASASNIMEGLKKLILGLAMKVILANNLGGLWAQPAIIGYESISTPAAWIALISYAMQLYLDFFGYSLMAIGIGKMFGFDLPENFIEPYSSRSVGEFYRRWHATLGAWFKEYVYIPLGGNRKGMLRTVINISIVWLLTGLWHGIGGNYLLWAGFICFFIINERLWLGKLLERSKICSHIYVIAAILFSWIPFAIGDWNQMLVFTGRLFGQGGAALNPRDYIEWLHMYAWLLLCSLVMMTPLPRMLWKKLNGSFIADIILVILFWVVVYYISTAEQNPFMYFQY